MAALITHKGPSRQVQGSSSNKTSTRNRNHEGRSISPRGTNPSIAQPSKQIVGNYQLLRKLGVGTFGEVRLAIHIPTGEKVAVKILEKSRVKEQADIRRVNREIKILKKARHGNVIQLYEVIDTPNAIYLMMENAEGGEMFDYIVAHRRLGEAEACKFFHQIVDGVEALHGFDITHRDLKPENLLLKAVPSGWVIKIADFGLSNTHEGGRFLSTACGSPCYAAPEMIAGKQYCGPLADIWSMGVILFALVCGYLPFEDPNTAMLYKKILAGDYKSPRWISGQVRNLISKILVTEPSKRYTLSDIKRHVWYGAVDQADIPRDTSTDLDSRRCHEETVRVMQLQGPDLQTLLDGVASRVCNPTTATYHLLLQKRRANRDLRVRTEGGELSGAVGPAQLRSHQLASPTCKRDEKENERYDSTNRPEKFRGIVQGGVIMRTGNNVKERDREDEIIITMPKNYHSINRIALPHEASFVRPGIVGKGHSITTAGSMLTSVMEGENVTVKSTSRNDAGKSTSDHNTQQTNTVNVIPSYLSLKVRNKIAAANAVPVIAVAHVVRRPDQQPPSFAGRRAIRSPVAAKTDAGSKADASPVLDIVGLSIQPVKLILDDELRAQEDHDHDHGPQGDELTGQKENSTRVAIKTSVPERATRSKVINREVDVVDGARIPAAAAVCAKSPYSVAGVFAAARNLTSHSHRPIVACIRKDKQSPSPFSAAFASPFESEVKKEGDSVDAIGVDVQGDMAVDKDNVHTITSSVNKLDLNEMTMNNIMISAGGNLEASCVGVGPGPGSSFLTINRDLELETATDGLERCGLSSKTGAAAAPTLDLDICDAEVRFTRGSLGNRLEEMRGTSPITSPSPSPSRDRRDSSDIKYPHSGQRASPLRQSMASPLLAVMETEEEDDNVLPVSRHASSHSQSLTRVRQREVVQSDKPISCVSDTFVSALAASTAALEVDVSNRFCHGVTSTASSTHPSQTGSGDIADGSAMSESSPTYLSCFYPVPQFAAFSKGDASPIDSREIDLKDADTNSLSKEDSSTSSKKRNVPVKPTPIRVGSAQSQSAYHGHRRLTEGNTFARPNILSGTQKPLDLSVGHTITNTHAVDGSKSACAEKGPYPPNHISHTSRSAGKHIGAQLRVDSDEVKGTTLQQLSQPKVSSASLEEISAIEHAEYFTVQCSGSRGLQSEEHPVTAVYELEAIKGDKSAGIGSIQIKEGEIATATAGSEVLVARPRPPSFPRSPSSPGTPRPPLTTKRNSIDSTFTYSQSRARRVVVPNGNAGS